MSEDKIYPSMVIRSQAEAIELLQQENEQLKERITYLENSNNRREETIINLRHEKQLDKYKEVIEEVREVIDTYKYVENDDGMYEPILDGYDIQKLLQILDKGGKNDE